MEPRKFIKASYLSNKITDDLDGYSWFVSTGISFRNPDPEVILVVSTAKALSIVQKTYALDEENTTRIDGILVRVKIGEVAFAGEDL